MDPVKVNQAEEEQAEAYDTSDPSQVNKARKKAARTRADRLEFIKAAMSVEQGRAWFYDILNRCHILRQPFVAGDPHSTSFRCGEMNIGAMILDDIQTAAPDDYIKMVRENKTVKNG